jgi:hypothetical protein
MAVREILIIGWLLLSLVPVIAGDLKVTWEPNTEPDLAGYFVYYGKKAQPLANRIDVGLQTQYLIQNLQAGVTYYISVTAVDSSGNESEFSEQVAARVLTGQEKRDGPQTQHLLLPIHPNPFHLTFDKSVVVAFELYEPAQAKLEIFNLLGQRVITLIDQALEAGAQYAPWNGRNAQSQPVKAGVYLYRLETARQISTRKLVIYH